MMDYDQRLYAALINLNTRIRRGEEFPDACSRAAFQWRVDYDDLRYSYDNQFGESE